MTDHSSSFPLAPVDVRRLVLDSVPSAHRASLDACSAAGASVAVGAFDGVHRGHRMLIESCKERACALGTRAVVVTFDPDPSEVVMPESCVQRLLSIEDRMAFCQSLGVDEVVVIPFTEEFSRRSPQDFITYLQELLGSMRSLHVGENFHFGHRGAGDAQLLAQIGVKRGFEVHVQPLMQVEGERVSSTRIRTLLAAGHVEEANSLLGRCHFVRGMVQHGRGEGTSFGFPTANIRCDQRACVPGQGVYACIVTDGERAWPAAANVGAPPTFTSEQDYAFLEANLLGFSGDLYGRTLSVLFVAWLRGSRTFSSLEELERVVLGNIAWVRDNIGAHEVEVRR